MENKFTPGPWQIGEAIRHRSLAIFDNNTIEGVVCEAICLVSPLEDVIERDFANAKLIAAAPDMLEALQDCAECLNILAVKLGIQVEGAPLKSDAESYGSIYALNKARIAINKATI